MKQSYHFFFVLVDVSPRNCGRMPPLLATQAMSARALFPISCLVVSFLMPYFILFHVLSSPIPCLVVSFLMPYFILFHVLSSPISCLVVSSSFAVAQPILSQISSRPRRVAADLREGHNQVQVGTQNPSLRPEVEGRGCAYWWIDSTKISSSGGITSLLSSYWAQLQTCPCL